MSAAFPDSLPLPSLGSRFSDSPQTAPPLARRLAVLLSC